MKVKTNIQQRNYIFLLCNILLLIISCQKNNEPTICTNKNIVSNFYKLSETEAADIVNNFIDAWNTNIIVTKGENEPIRTISNDISAICITPESKSFYNHNSSDTLMYIVNLNDDLGYVIVSADKRTTPILGFIEQGRFTSIQENTNPGFQLFMEYAANTIIQNSTKETKAVAPPNTQTVFKLNEVGIPLRTKWKQGAPYNKYHPSEGTYTGCTIVAAAQALSRFQGLKQFSYTDRGTTYNCTLEWDNILNECLNNDGALINGSSCADQIAHLMRYLGIIFKADYKPEGTGASPEEVSKYFNTLSGIGAGDVVKYNGEKVILNINNGQLAMIVGYSFAKKFLGIITNVSKGHTWLIDSYINATATPSSITPIYTLLHCNYGWGGIADGYYASEVFDTNTNGFDVVNDTRPVSKVGTEGYYQYKLQYMTIWP